jgi:hypothetical protein
MDHIAHRGRAATFVAASLLLGQLLFIAELVVNPTNTDKELIKMTAAAAHPGAWYAVGVLDLLAFVLLTFGTIGTALLIGRRGKVFTSICAAVVALGVIGFSAGLLIQSVQITLAQHYSHRAAAHIDDQLSNTGYVVPLIVCIIAGLLAQGVFVWATFRAGLVRWWAPALATVSLVLSILVGNGSSSPMLNALSYLPLLVAYGFVAAGLAGRTAGAARGVRVGRLETARP